MQVNVSAIIVFQQSRELSIAFLRHLFYNNEKSLCIIRYIALREMRMAESGFVVFYHKQTPKSLLRPYDNAEKISVDKLKRDMLLGRQEQSILFILPNAKLASAAALCKETGCKNVSVLIPDNGFRTEEPIRIDVSKPRLNYMETEISRRCNLNCRGCCDFIQLAGDEPPFYDPDAFIQDLSQLKTKFWGVEKIRLMGGEPLLIKEIDAYAEQTRRIFPDADIRIVTNGLMIPTLSSETLAKLKKLGVSFDISNYPPTRHKRKEIAGTLRHAGVSYDFGPPIRCFLKNISEQPAEDPKPSFDNCLFTHCHMMNQGGILTPCSFAYCIRRFNRRFGADYTEADCIDLYQTDKDGWQIMEWLSNPHLFCCSCTAGMVPIRWRDGVHRDDAVKEDWIIPKNICTDHVIPFLQHMLIPAAKSLRAFIQRNKN